MVDYRWVKRGLMELIRSKREDTYYWGDKIMTKDSREDRVIEYINTIFVGQELFDKINKDENGFLGIRKEVLDRVR